MHEQGEDSPTNDDQRNARETKEEFGDASTILMVILIRQSVSVALETKV